jgi:GT2 family glycosyltransferase
VITLAILNFNGRAFLEAMLPTVAAQTASDFVVHVVDDASTDDSVAWLREHWPDVRVITSERNLQITASLARAVQTASTPYVAILNNDLELDPRWLEELLAAIEADPRLAGVEGKTLAFDDRGVIDGAGDMLSRTGHPTRRGQGEPDDGRYDAPAEIFNTSCTAALFRAAAYADVGTFDTDLVAYHEDTDWGYRARLRGWRFAYVPTAVAYHRGSATTTREPGRYTHLIIRNELLLTVKNLPGRLLLRWGPRLLWFHVDWFARNVAHGIGRQHLHGVGAALVRVPRWRRKRRAGQRGRTIALDELVRLMDLADRGP